VKDKIYHILSEKLFDMADLYYEATKYKVDKETSEIFDRGIWSEYLHEMGFLKLILSGWFKNEDLDGGGTEDFSFADPEGRKVDPRWIEENFTVVNDPLNKYRRVGIPREIAVKALALGHFPDSPSVQKMREGFPHDI